MSKLSVSDRAFVSAIKLHILEGGDLDSFHFHMTKDSCRNHRYTLKKKFKSLFDKYLAEDEDVKKKIWFNETLHSVLNMGKS